MGRQKHVVMYKIIAIITLVSMIAAKLPDTAIIVRAEEVGVLTVSMQEDINEADIILTNQNTEEIIHGSVSDGIAQLSVSVEDVEVYTLEVKDAIGYEDYREEDIIFESNEYEISLTELEKITVAGVVLDDSNKAYAGAEVTVKGYTEAETQTDDEGGFSLSIYKNQEYSLIVTAGVEYEIYEVGFTDISEDIDDLRITLTSRMFDIHFMNDGGGHILSNGREVENTAAVRYGSSPTYSIKADETYMIDKLLIDDVDIEEAKGKAEYEYQFENVQSDRTMSVTFVKKIHTITFKVNEDGKVTYIVGDNEQEGTVMIESPVEVEEGLSLSFTAIPADNYHVQNIAVDTVNISLESDPNITEDGKTYTYTFAAINKSFEVEITFAIDEYQVEFVKKGNGSFFVDGEPAGTGQDYSYGSQIEIDIIPDEGYYLSGLKIQEKDERGEAEWLNVDIDNPFLYANNDGSYRYTIDSMQDDLKIKAVFEKIEENSSDIEDYLRIEIIEGSNVDIVEEENVRHLLYSNDTKLVLQPLDDYNVSFISAPEEGGISGTYSPKIEISDSIEIQGIYIKNNSGSLKNSVKFISIEPVVKIVIDKTAPLFEDDVKKEPTDDWTNREVVISGTVKDEGGSGVWQVRYSDKADDYSRDTADRSASSVNITEPIDGEFSFSVDNSEDFSGVYYIWAYDRAGNKSANLSISIGIDIQKPLIVKLKNETGTGPVKTSVNITGEVSDAGGSGINSVRYSNDVSSYRNDEFNKVNGSAGIAEISKTGEGAADYSFEIKNDESFSGYYYVWAYDNAGNKSACHSVEVLIDIHAPVIKNIVKNPDNKWAQKEVEIIVDIADERADTYDSGLAGIYFNTTGILDDYTVIEESESPVSFYTLKDENENAQFEGYYYVWAFDKAGNISERARIEVKIDTTQPTIEDVVVEPKNQGILPKVINFLSFGIFFNEAVEVTVTANDEEISSGLDSIALYGEDSLIESKKADNGQAVFTLEIPFTDYKYIAATATDNAGWVSEKTIPQYEDGDMRIMLEEDPPLIDLELPEPVYQNRVNGETIQKWYSEDIVFDLVIEDEYSGIYSVEVEINEKEIKKDANGKEIKENYYEEEIHTLEFCLGTKDILPEADGSYNIVIRTVDNAGNKAEKKEVIYIDTESPHITKMEFLYQGGIIETTDFVEFNDYGFYFKEDTKVRIYAADNKSAAEDDIPSSGLRTITYRLIDYTSGEDISESAQIMTGENDYIEIELQADFKGRIMAKAEDNVGHESDDFVEPNGTIVESKEKHEETSFVKIELPRTKYKDKKNLELYQDDVEIAVVVNDSYSGIQKVEWSVEAEHDQKNNQAGIFYINNRGRIENIEQSGVREDIEELWGIDSVQNNLVYEMSAAIPIRNNSNEITLKVKLTDRAGHIAEEKVKLSIDKTDPIINIFFEDENKAPLVENIYGSNRRAVVEIHERNFDEDWFEIVFNSSTPEGIHFIPKLSEWEHYENEENPDACIHRAYVEYTAEGDYSIEAVIKDLSGRQNEYAIETFVIDKTNPNIDVDFRNADYSDENKKWYKADVDFSIKLTDNWSGLYSTEILINGESMLDADKILYSGRIYADTITVSTKDANIKEDGSYTLEVRTKDRANKEHSYSYTIYKDITPPEITEFRFSETKYQEGDGKPSDGDGYGYYFKDEITVTVAAEDAGPSSNIHSITYYAIDEGMNEEEMNHAIENAITKEVDENNTISFILPADFKGQVYAIAADNVGNVSGRYVKPDAIIVESKEKHDESSDIEFKYEKTRTTDKNNIELYNADVPVSIIMNSSFAGIRSVNWSVTADYDKNSNQSGYIEIDSSGNIITDDKLQDYEMDQNLVTEIQKDILVTHNSNRITVRVEITDRAGYVTENTMVISIDKTEPQIALTYDNINHYKPGFYKSDRTATIVITERNFASEDVELRIVGQLGNEVQQSGWIENKNTSDPDLTTYTKTIIYSAEDNYTFDISCKDMAGNKAKEFDTQTFTIDKQKPKISVTYPNAVYKDSSNRLWYNGNIAFNLNITDNLAGIYSVVVKLNGIQITSDKNGKRIDQNFYSGHTVRESFLVNTDQAVINTDGSYHLEIEVYDNSGNKNNYQTTVYKDTTRPNIVKFDFAAAGIQEANGEIVQVMDYGYYFLDEVQVTISAEDIGPSAGLKSITYYTVDYSSNSDGVKSGEVTQAVNSSGKISFTLPAEFKGQIYAVPKDNVNNPASSSVKPNSVVQESASMHMQSSSITLTKPTAAHKDNNNLDLYDSNVNVDVVVSDTHSGIRTIEWEVRADYDTGNNQSGAVTVDNSGGLSGDSSGWAMNTTDTNLITQMSRTLAVANNSNNIKVWVKLTDRAGNSSEEEISFSIDKTTPVIQITYDNNTYDSAFSNETEYYKENRTATIVVTERNFSANDVNITITNTDGAVPSVSGWTEARNSSDPDQSTYTATISYTSDGDYTFAMSFADLAGNQAASISGHRFTLDKTLPVIEVSYDNNDGLNDNYYKEERTATVTIREHNFETTRINITMTAKDGTETVDIPTVSGWASSGDVHSATILFEEDAYYTLAVEYTDKAGNEAQKYDNDDFYVDKTLPEVVLSGVTYKSANSGKDKAMRPTDVGFTIQATDRNFEDLILHLDMITLSGKRSKDELLANAELLEDGVAYSIKNLEEDGIYVLSGQAIDKAGNINEEISLKSGDGNDVDVEEVMFSVNRNGSVYLLDAETEAINGTYSQKEIDIVIKEINVNELTDVKITLFNEASTSILEEGIHYEVEKAGGEGEWSEYTYTIFKNNFAQDGVYSLALYSVDEADNESENTMDTKEVEVRFSIDKTNPNIIVTDLESKVTYAQDMKEVTMVISDNMKLQKVEVYHATYSKDSSSVPYGEVFAAWEGAEIEELQAGNIDFKFEITGDSTDRHKVLVLATDAAGGKTEAEIIDFYVTKDWWINFRTNIPLFYGSIGGTFGVVIAVGIFFIYKRKKKKDESS